MAPDGVPDDAPHLVALRHALAGIDPSTIDLTDELARLRYEYEYEVVGVPYEFRDQEGNLVSELASRCDTESDHGYGRSDRDRRLGSC